MNKKKVIIIGSILLAILVIAGLYGTLATGETALSGDNVYNITLTGSSNEVVVPAGTSKTVIYQITNTNKGKVNYGLVYGGDNIEVKVYDDTIDSETGLVDYGETKFVKLIITNTGTTDSTASVKTVLGYENDTNLNQSNLVPSGHSFVTEVHKTKPETLLEHLTNLYISGNPTLIMNEYYYSYQDTGNTWGLMNDGLKIDTTVVTDTIKLTTGSEGNIRYFGPGDSVNNYMYFNCSDYSNQTDSTCEIWRIIGIVDGKVKIIRNESLGPMTWDYKSDGTYDNSWDNATLNTILNETYYTRGSASDYYFDYDSGLQKEKTVSFAENGITDSTKKLISLSTWYTNRFDDYEIYPDTSYINERTGDSTWSGNIALLYPSDYGYSADLKRCRVNMSSYSECIDYNWLWNIMENAMLTDESDGGTGCWLSTAISSDSYYALYVNQLGSTSSSSTRTMGSILPVLYLDPELIIEPEGDGSSTNPYRIKPTSITENGDTPSTSSDTTPPEIVVAGINTLTYKFQILYSVEDLESGIESFSCEYGTDTNYGSYGTIEDGSCYISAPSSGTYYYKLTAINGVGLVSVYEGSHVYSTYGGSSGGSG